jgi:hypothetical protein
MTDVLISVVEWEWSREKLSRPESDGKINEGGG